ncbi:hypothetical protein BJ741DRAFT_608163 [Chytriomyces cf. hyalinus JEL632]|nr:hypothetical protein BJ741DRAFT_608163 [Chytriomyces cf. hyalinus JEL632]
MYILSFAWTTQPVSASFTVFCSVCVRILVPCLVGRGKKNSLGRLSIQVMYPIDILNKPMYTATIHAIMPTKPMRTQEPLFAAYH